MKLAYAWMPVVFFAASLLLAGCKEKTEETVTQAPTQEEPLQAFPENQVPAAEPQPAALPPVDTSVPRADTTAKATEQKPVYKSPAPKENYAPAKKKDVRYYVVKKGDTLQKISQKYYGTTKKWRTIYKANRDSLSKGADKLQVGSKLVIP